MLKSIRSLQFKYSFFKIGIFILFLTLFAVIFTGAVYANQAADFYENSNVRFYYEDGSFYLELDTPVAVLCAVNFTRVEKDYNHMTAMDMVAPAENHLVELDLETDRQYRVMLTAFTENHEIYRSQEYILDTSSVENRDDLLISREGEAQVIEVEASDEGFVNIPEVTEVSGSGASLEFSTAEPTLSSTAIGLAEDFGRVARASGREPARDHEVSLPGLESDSEYYSETITIDETGELIRSEMITFKTLELAEEDYGENFALLEKGADISGVSSNFGNDIAGSFGALNAIDGDPGTEWSSQGEGDNAWIEIELAEKIKVTGFGFWSRTMGDTGEITKLRVLDGAGEVLGEFEIPDAEKLYNFSLTPVQAQKLRFEVVESTGGNTGARVIRVYGNN
ncbi:MAG: discoidin domain-containing protein [Halarsenatibacteraceae bacterium]